MGAGSQALGGAGLAPPRTAPCLALSHRVPSGSRVPRPRIRALPRAGYPDHRAHAPGSSRMGSETWHGSVQRRSLTLLAAGGAGVRQEPCGSPCPGPERCQARPAMPQPPPLRAPATQHPTPWPSPAQGDRTQTPASLVTAPSATRQCPLATSCPWTHWPCAHLPSPLRHRAEMGKQGLEPPHYPEPRTAPPATAGLSPADPWPCSPDGNTILRSRSSTEPHVASPAAPSPPGEPDPHPGSSVAIQGAASPSWGEASQSEE